MFVSGADGDDFAAFQAGEPVDEWQAQLPGMCVGQDESFVVGTLADGEAEALVQLPGDDNFLFAHVSLVSLGFVRKDNLSCA